MRLTIYWLANIGAMLFLGPAIGIGDDAARDDVAIENAIAAAGLPASEQRQTPAEEASDQREREGTRLVNQLGRFKITGDRLTFQPTGSDRQYLGLENLALERIGKVLADRQDQVEQLEWEVTASFTEYRGTNYLLITHAVLKTKAARGSAVLSTATP